MAKASVSWDFDLERKQLFLCINGRKSIGDDGEHLVLDEIGHGKSANDIWVKFINTKKGRNLQIKNFYAESQFSKKINSSSVVEIIDKVTTYCPWIELHRRKRKLLEQTPASSTSKLPKITVEEPTDINLEMVSLVPPPMNENYLGKFEVNILTLMSPPEQYLARRLNYEWVCLLKNKLSSQPNHISTIFPVMIDPAQVKNREEFCPEKLASYCLWTLGGNHLRTAMQQLAKEAYLNEIRNVQIHLYMNLDQDQAISIANLHNGAQTSLKPTFQDNVYQSIKLKEESDEELASRIAKMLSEIEMKNIPKESVGTLVSVCRYSKENLDLFHLLVKKFVQKHGSFKSIPQVLFKELQGVKDQKRTPFLQLAVDKTIEKATLEVKRSKKRSKLQECMVKVTKSRNFNECIEKYPAHCEGIDRFLDLDIEKNRIPIVFSQFCNEAKEYSDLMDSSHLDFKIDIDLKIKINDRNAQQCHEVKKIIEKIKSNTMKMLLRKKFDIVNEIEEQITELDSGVVIEDSMVEDSMIEDSMVEDSVVEQLDSVPSSDEETQPPVFVSQDIF